MYVHDPLFLTTVPITYTFKVIDIKVIPLQLVMRLRSTFFGKGTMTLVIHRSGGVCMVNTKLLYHVSHHLMAPTESFHCDCVSSKMGGSINN